jgi:hypothetical protein
MQYLLSLLRKPIAGPCVLGLFVGLVLGIALASVGLDRGQFVLIALAPIGAIVSTFSAMLSINPRPLSLLRTAFLASISTCIPVPLLTLTMMLWLSGTEVLDLHNLPLVAFLVGIFSLLGAIVGWPLSLAAIRLKNRHSTSTARS